ncbi:MULTISPECIES: Abi family protein [Salinimonas]|uniref:Abi family protein n=2 Tax=Salinimonas TaxID=288793 RepID=A0A5B7YIT9_9ALTE|nr:MULTISPECIES: Abi family protein [Salinimonas]MBD3587530.1 Abi family protein [Salinimonas profundi]QCZ95557.1 Abi family protein [Salinimonas iocasae]
MDFRKSPTTFEEQLSKLESRGLIISDRASAKHYLSHINYYRFGVYAWYFLENKQNHTFYEGTRFEDVLQTYVFDRELRILILEAVERIEVSLRTSWAYNFSHINGPHGHLNPRNFNFGKGKTHLQFLSTLLSELNRTKESYIKEQMQKYNEATPAIWICCEVMSFGSLSKAFSSTRNLEILKLISQEYNLNHEVLKSFLHHLTVVRNICAHHSRLWNRNLQFQLKIPTNGDRSFIKAFTKCDKNKLYNTLVMLSYLLRKVSPDTSWAERLKGLVSEYPAIDPSHIGFPKQYNDFDFWNN